MSEGPAPASFTLRQGSSLVALVAVAAIAWAFLVAGEAAMTSMRGHGVVAHLMWLMMKPGDTLPYLLAATAMWVVMMLAMMIPSVIPMALVYRRMDRSTTPDIDMLIFCGGYLAGWSAFGVAAAVVQWGLHRAGALVGMLLTANAHLAAWVLVAAGIYQLTPLKDACLSHCRSPLSFFLQHWRDGRAAAFDMGFRHGIFCIGCCWMLMLLMFAGGAMSVTTMAALSVFILAERLLPAGPWVSRLPGFALLATGAVVLWNA